ncbi:MAG: hypothetical protein C4330_05180 [Chitinophagaceae bacterium]
MEVMSIDKNNASVNHQDHPHQKGQQNNTPSIQDTNGQRRSNNNNQPMSNLLNKSEEQRTGSAHGQQDESDVQEEERLS